MKEITKKTTLAQALELEGAREILAKHKVPCLFCPMAAQEAAKLSLEQIARAYQLDLEALLEDLSGLKR